jgi:hypothetical protein
MRCTNELSVKTSFVYTVEGGLRLSTFYPTISQMKPVFGDIILIWMSSNSHYMPPQLLVVSQAMFNAVYMKSSFQSQDSFDLE